MPLNRSSYWTLPTGEKIRVKRMSTSQIQLALAYLSVMELEIIGHDPYIIQQFCSTSKICNVLPEPQYKKDGFFIEDWSYLFQLEIQKRIKFVATQSVPFNVSHLLVKWLKFW